MKINQNLQKKRISAKADPRQKPLISMKEYVNQILDNWFRQNQGQYNKWVEKYSIFKLIDYDPYIKDGLKRYLFFTLNVKEVKVTQQLAPKYNQHLQIFHDICNRYSQQFFSKIETLISDQNCIEFKEIILTEILTVLRYIPSQFEQYSPDQNQISSQYNALMYWKGERKPIQRIQIQKFEQDQDTLDI